MPVWAVTLIWKVAVPLLVEILKRTGAVNVAEAWAAKAALKLSDAVGNLKIDPTYPTAKGITDTPHSIQAWKDRTPPGIKK